MHPLWGIKVDVFYEIVAQKSHILGIPRRILLHLWLLYLWQSHCVVKTEWSHKVSGMTLSLLVAQLEEIEMIAALRNLRTSLLFSNDVFKKRHHFLKYCFLTSLEFLSLCLWVRKYPWSFLDGSYFTHFFLQSVFYP